MRTTSWVLLTIVGELTLLVSLGSAGLGYRGSYPIGADGTSIEDVAAGRPAVLEGLRGIRGTSAAYAAAYAVLFLAIVIVPYRRGEVWAWWALFAAIAVLAAIVLLRMAFLSSRLGVGPALVPDRPGPAGAPARRPTAVVPRGLTRPHFDALADRVLRRPGCGRADLAAPRRRRRCGVPELDDAVGHGIRVWSSSTRTTSRPGAFKVRNGARAVTALSPEERARGVVAATRGNHGAGLACARRATAAPGHHLRPARQQPREERRHPGLGAERLEAGHDYDSADRGRDRLVRERGMDARALDQRGSA